MQRTRRTQATGQSAAVAAAVRTDPVGAVGHVLDIGAQGHGLGHDLGGVAAAHVKYGVGRQFHTMVVGDVAAANVVGVGGQGQARHPFQVVFGAQFGDDLRYAGHLVAFVGFDQRLGQLSLGIGRAAHQAQAGLCFTEETPFHATVTLLAVGGVDSGDRVGVGAGFFNLKHGQGGGEGAQVELGAGLILLGLVRAEDFPRVGGAGGCRAPLGQPFDVVGIERNFVGDLDQQRRRGRHLAVAVAGRLDAGRRQAGAFHGLVAPAHGPLHAAIEERQGVEERKASQLGFAAGGNGAVFAQRRCWAEVEVVVVGDHIVGDHQVFVAHLRFVLGGCQRPGVAYRAGVEHALEAGFTGLLRALPVRAISQHVDVPGVVDQRVTGHQGIAATVALAIGGKGGERVIEVDLATDQHGFGVVDGVGPVRCQGVVALPRAGHFIDRRRDADAEIGGAIQALTLLVSVQGQAYSLSAPVQAQGVELHLLLLVVHAGVAIAVYAVVADTELVLLAKASTHVSVGAIQPLGFVTGGDPCQRFVGGALGHHVDAAGDAAIGRHAVEQRRRALEHFDALGQFGRAAQVRRHAGQAVEGDVVGAGVEAADEEGFEDGPLGRHVDRRVSGTNHRADVLGLVVAHEFIGVADGVERRFHEVLGAQQPDTTARGDLPTRVRRWQVVGGEPLALDGGFRQHQAVLFRFGPGLGGRLRFRRRRHCQRAAAQPEQQGHLHGAERAVQGKRESTRCGLG